LFGSPSGGDRDGEGRRVTGQAGGLVWPAAAPPPATSLLAWELHDVVELPRVRAELRRHPATAAPRDDPRLLDVHDQLVLALDEMASNALRHGGGRVKAVVAETADAFLVEVSDQATDSPPAPAVGRDPSEGGLGLYLIAEMAIRHGWYVRHGAKHVWALLPRT
jgi:anti-sigma regulatory factor (Ser/Thr protein kinase)